ncbi:unannotated protein [freshwater metagenome]|uniref:Unannotated protein n=1 Tax=freshwater metagenome TaxID=449393 RepID=A0A6J7RCM2_9ZZZZ
MLDDATNRVALNLTRGDHQGGAVDDDLEHHLGLGEGHVELVRGQRHVPNLRLVAVDHGGNESGGAQLAGHALSEVVAGDGGNGDVGHER